MTEASGATTTAQPTAAGVAGQDRRVLAYAGGVYRDTLPLALGVVRPPSFDLRYCVYPVEELLTSPDAHLRHDATEYSLGRLFGLPPEDRHLLGVPVFPARAFRHSAIYVRADSSLSSPAELAGKRVGIPRWTQTAVIWTRGIIADRYGVDLHEIRWVIASRILATSSYREQDAGDASGPAGFDVQSVSPDTSLHEQLLTGAVDAVITANPLPTGPGAAFRHLVESATQAEREYFV
jgi:4,5-dihydroxyphthalate decarboxylase